MKTLGFSSNFVLHGLLAVLLVASAATRAGGSSVNRCNWDDLSKEMCGNNQEDQDSGNLSAEIWLARDTDIAPVVRPAAAEGEDPLRAFTLSEQTLIPLPAAEWTGLAGLLGLAAVRARKALRRIFI